MLERKSRESVREQLRRTALARRENEGGAGAGHELDSAAEPSDAADAPPLTNTELVQLQVRVIALESVMTALLAEASEAQIERACERALYIVPRPGRTPHRLTISAAARIAGMISDAAHFRELQPWGRAASRRDAPGQDGDGTR